MRRFVPGWCLSLGHHVPFERVLHSPSSCSLSAFNRSRYTASQPRTRLRKRCDCSKSGKTGVNRKEREPKGGRAMRLRILLPKVNPEAITVPTRCVYAGCGGRNFHLRQQVSKPFPVAWYHEDQCPPYQCLQGTRPS